MKKLGMPQYLGYVAGDAANNLSFSMVTGFLILYYTDVIGAEAAATALPFGAQTEATINGMKMGIGLLPAIVIAVACAVMAFYSLTDDRFSEIVAELRARRADGK